VQALRRFRDERLAPTAPGRPFIRLYYAYSPAAADYVRSNPWLAFIVRLLLPPLVYGLLHPISAIPALAAGAAAALALRLRGWGSFPG